jgi:hypothetical protein
VTIRKGEAWGTEVARPSGLRVARTDAELASWVSADPGGAYGVAGGDLHRTVGTPRAAGATAHRLPIDVLDVATDGRRHLAVAHVVVRRPHPWGWWRGPATAVCNVDHVGRWNVAPRAHPNDGRFDVVEVAARMRLRDRWEARRRLPTGSHVPHPAIALRTATDWTWTGAAHVWVDGVDTGPATEVTVRILPDASAIHV